MRISYYQFPENVPDEIVRQYCDDDGNVTSCTVTFAKKMLKQYGGCAWTEHIDRDGGCFEVTPITVGGNNSRFKYNHHL